MYTANRRHKTLALRREDNERVFVAYEGFAKVLGRYVVGGEIGPRQEISPAVGDVRVVGITMQDRPGDGSC